MGARRRPASNYMAGTVTASARDGDRTMQLDPYTPTYASVKMVSGEQVKLRGLEVLHRVFRGLHPAMGRDGRLR